MVKKFTLLIMLLAICCSAQAANYLTFTAEVDSALFLMKNDGGNNPDVRYSMDGGETWSVLHAMDTIVLKKKNDKVLLRGNNPDGFSRSNFEITRFEIYSPIAASGSVMSLLDNTGESKTIPEPASYCFTNLFILSEGLTQAPELPATSLSEYCYSSMFAYCPNLRQAPELPATTLAEYCYLQMFNGCAGLTQIPTLSATTLAEKCYMGMFQDCKGLTQVPDFPKIKLAVGCYLGMFQGCTSLTQAPALPSTGMEIECYAGMFQGCTSLTQAPALPSTELDNECYTGMFQGCTSLTQAPELPATRMNVGCYANMFRDCIGLTQAPALPALTLVRDCYKGMFEGCTGLTSFPEISATSLTNGCCYQMFSGCANISEATVHFSDWQDSAFNWLLDVSETGTFTCPRALLEQYEFGPSAIPYGWNVQFIDRQEGDTINYLTFTAEADSSSFALSFGYEDYLLPYLNAYYTYSLDNGASWDTLKVGEFVVLAKKGDKALLRGYNSRGLSEYEPQITGEDIIPTGTALEELDLGPLICSNFVMTGSIAASGSVMSLIDNMGMGKKIPEQSEYCFARLFKDCTSLTQAPELPATTLGRGCYCKMFAGCTNLKNAPALPATALDERCYAGMFAGCTGMAQAPKLSADSLAEECYFGMFIDCTGLTQAPDLPATGYARGCYHYMFKDCANLSQIKVNFSEWSEDEYGTATDTWVEGVAPTGTFICPKELPKEYGVSRIPEGWRVAFTNEPRGGKDVVSGSFFTWTEDLTICVRGVDGLVEVYGLNGQLLRAAHSSTDETITFTMPSRGVYVVKTADESVKVDL